MYCERTVVPVVEEETTGAVPPGPEGSASSLIVEDNDAVTVSSLATAHGGQADEVQAACLSARTPRLGDQ